MQDLCQNKKLCGSCSWSHIPYQKQLQQKLFDINGSFALKKLGVRVDKIVASPKTSHYRNRMDFVIDFEGRIGMRQKGKWWKVIDGHTCFLADKQIEQLFHAMRDWTKTAGLTFFDRKAHTGLLRYAVIRVARNDIPPAMWGCKGGRHKGQTMLTIVTSEPEDETEVQNALEQLAEIAGPTTLIWSINHTITDVSFGDELRTIAGSGYIEELIDGKTYRITPNAFFQTNSHGAEVLLSSVKEYAGDLKEKTLLDLYCGSGFFSIALADKAKRTIGVELVPEAIRDARTNAELNFARHSDRAKRAEKSSGAEDPSTSLGMTNTIQFHDAKTEEFDWKALNPDVVILDPPRSGMHDKALADVIEAKPQTIVYVSCNYKNFARELVELQKYYRVDAMRAIDMFPHTPHVELIIKLTLAK